MDDSKTQKKQNTPITVDSLPTVLQATRRRLKKALLQVEHYRTTLRLASHELEQRNHHLIALATFAYQASRVSNLSNLLKLLLKQALKTIDAPVGAVVLVEGKSKELSLTYQRGLTEGLNNILTGKNMSHGAAMLMPHLVSGTGALIEYETAQEEMERELLDVAELSSLVSLPIKTDKRLIGALIIGLQGKRQFKSSELTFLMAISQETAIAIDSLGLRERLWHMAESMLNQEEKQPPIVSDIGPPTEGAELSEQELLIPKNVQSDFEEQLQEIVQAEDMQQNTDFQVLISYSEVLSHCKNITEVLQSAVEQTTFILHTDAAWFYSVEQNEQLKLKAHIGLSENYVHGMRRLGLEDGVEGIVVKENKPCFVASIMKYPHKIWVVQEGLRAIAAVPIIDFQEQSWQVKGVLATGIRGSQAHAWSQREMRLLISIGNQLALSLEKNEAYTEVKNSQLSLQDSNHILREINDMLIQKNAVFEKFVRQDIMPQLNQMTQLLDTFVTRNNIRLNDVQREQIDNMKQLVNDLKNSSQNILSK